MSKEQELRESVRSFIDRMMAGGFNSEQDMKQQALEVASDDASEFEIDLDDDALQRIADEEFAAARKARQAEMATWPKVTDCDRLDAAFTELNAMGIMARHNWTCCGNCGSALMPEEFKRIKGKANGKPIIGYIFYHQQGTESAAEGQSLYFSFGTTTGADSEAEYDQKAVAIARTACDVINKHGLKTIWNGTYAQRPCINLDWKRRNVPKDYVDCDGPGHGAPPVATLATTPQPEPATMGAQSQGLIAKLVALFTGK